MREASKLYLTRLAGPTSTLTGGPVSQFIDDRIRRTDHALFGGVELLDVFHVV